MTLHLKTLIEESAIKLNKSMALLFSNIIQLFARNFDKNLNWSTSSEAGSNSMDANWIWILNHALSSCSGIKQSETGGNATVDKEKEVNPLPQTNDEVKAESVITGVYKGSKVSRKVYVDDKGRYILAGNTFSTGLEKKLGTYSGIGEVFGFDWKTIRYKVNEYQLPAGSKVYLPIMVDPSKFPEDKVKQKQNEVPVNVDKNKKKPAPKVDDIEPEVDVQEISVEELDVEDGPAENEGSQTSGNKNKSKGYLLYSDDFNPAIWRFKSFYESYKSLGVNGLKNEMPGTVTKWYNILSTSVTATVVKKIASFLGSSVNSNFIHSAVYFKIDVPVPKGISDSMHSYVAFVPPKGIYIKKLFAKGILNDPSIDEKYRPSLSNQANSIALLAGILNYSGVEKLNSKSLKINAEAETLIHPDTARDLQSVRKGHRMLHELFAFGMGKILLGIDHEMAQNIIYYPAPWIGTFSVDFGLSSTIDPFVSMMDNVHATANDLTASIRAYPEYWSHAAELIRRYFGGGNV